jgi:putative membrane protein
MKIHPMGLLSLATMLVFGGMGVVHAAGNAASAGSSAASTVSAGDRSFMAKVAGGGMYEVEVSKLAEQKATDQSVKEHAAMLVKDHTNANNELTQLASSKGVALPAKLPRDKQAGLDKLSKTSGPSFDREFMRKVGIADHQADIKLFENGSRTAKDPELKAWIDKTLPTLREHLAHAQKTPLTTASAKSAKAGGSAGVASGSKATP